MKMERVPRTGLFMHHQSTAPAPPPDLQWWHLSPQSLCHQQDLLKMLPVVVRHHVVPTHTVQMVFLTRTMYIPAQVVQMWVVIILRNACIYMRSGLKSKSGPLTRRSVTWIVLPSLYFFLDLESQKGRSVIKLHLFDTE